MQFTNPFQVCGNLVVIFICSFTEVDTYILLFVIQNKTVYIVLNA